MKSQIQLLIVLSFLALLQAYQPTLLQKYYATKLKPNIPPVQCDGTFQFPELNLTNSDITTISMIFAKCNNTQLKSLTINLLNNQISDLTFLQLIFQNGTNYNNLRKLEIQMIDNDLVSLNGIRQAFSKLSNLSQLTMYFSNNKLSDIQLMSGAFLGLYKLEQVELYLNNNKIANLDPIFQGLKWIVDNGLKDKFDMFRLYAGDNNLTQVQTSIQILKSFPNLQDLVFQLDNNHITDLNFFITFISSGFQNVQSMYLFFNKNGIVSFPNLNIQGQMLPKINEFQLEIGQNQMTSFQNLTQFLTYIPKLERLKIQVNNNQVAQIDDSEENIINFAKKIVIELEWEMFDNKFSQSQIQKIGQLKQKICTNIPECSIDY